MIKPERDYHWTLKNFLDNKQYAPIFFNSLLNIHKFMNYESRDPFMVRNEVEKNPDFTDWDKFVYNEYIKLTVEDNEENQEE